MIDHSDKPYGGATEAEGGRWNLDPTTRFYLKREVAELSEDTSKWNTKRHARRKGFDAYWLATPRLNAIRCRATKLHHN
jgi:hypothetical protein